jgi:two-component system sensor histidine kinase CpxA
LPWYGVWLSAFEQPGALALRMGAILITAGLLCYGLARYLTAPVLRLRNATRALAAGDLGVRVGPAVGNRRDELAELGRDFDLMAERIETLLTAQRQLLSDVSHELRSPLARLNVALALARQRAGAQAEAPLDRIEVEAEQLNALIGRVLALARFESGAVEPEFGQVDLVRLVEDIAADADFEADPKGASVAVRAQESFRVEGNEPLLRSAIENVVRNAVRYTAPGTVVEIAVTPKEPAADAPGVVIAVRDRGPGVPEDQLEELFKPFYRIADARDRQSGGTGLGLSITERAVRLHGGTVRAANAPDGGLLVEIELPL